MAVSADNNGKPGSARGQGQTGQQSGGAVTVTSGSQPNGPAATTTTDKWAYYPRRPDQVTVNTSTLQGVANASDYSSPTWNKEYSQSDTNLEWDSLDADYQQSVLELAKSRGGRSGSALWEKAVAISEKSVRDGDPKTPFQILYEMGMRGATPSSNGPGGRGPGGGGSGGGSAGPRVTYSNADAFSVRAIADSVSMEMLGRGVSQKEMERILKRVRKYENRNPSVTTADRSSGGVSSAGYEEVVSRLIAKNPEYGDYQKATTMMDWFDSALNERLQNG